MAGGGPKHQTLAIGQYSPPQKINIKHLNTQTFHKHNLSVPYNQMPNQPLQGITLGIQNAAYKNNQSYFSPSIQMKVNLQKHHNMSPNKPSSSQDHRQQIFQTPQQQIASQGTHLPVIQQQNKQMMMFDSPGRKAMPFRKNQFNKSDLKVGLNQNVLNTNRRVLSQVNHHQNQSDNYSTAHASQMVTKTNKTIDSFGNPQMMQKNMPPAQWGGADSNQIAMFRKLQFQTQQDRNEIIKLKKEN